MSEREGERRVVEGEEREGEREREEEREREGEREKGERDLHPPAVPSPAIASGTVEAVFVIKREALNPEGKEARVGWGGLEASVFGVSSQACRACSQLERRRTADYTNIS